MKKQIVKIIIMIEKVWCIYYNSLRNILSFLPESKMEHRSVSLSFSNYTGVSNEDTQQVKGKQNPEFFTQTQAYDWFAALVVLAGIAYVLISIFSAKFPSSAKQNANKQAELNYSAQTTAGSDMRQEDNHTEAAVSDYATSQADAAESASQLKQFETMQYQSSTDNLMIPQKTGSVKEYPASDISSYPRYLDAVRQQFTTSGDDYLEWLGYSLCDINQDNIPELFVAYMPGYREDSSYIAEAYCISDNKVYTLTDNGHEPFIGLTDKGFLTFGGFSPDGTMTFKRYEGNAMHSEWDQVQSVLDDDNFSYSLHNKTTDCSITENDFHAVIESYGSHYELSLTPLASILRENKQESTSPADIRNDDPLWEYKDTSNLVAVGKATPIGSVLSIRPYESDDVEALIQIAKGSYVGILYFDRDWMYVKYYADYDSPIYYGYVRANKIEVTKYYTGSFTAAVFTTTGESVNLRSKPSTNSSVLTQIPCFSVVELESWELYSGEWLKVTYEGQTGYVRRDLVGRGP